jgi:transposase
MERSIIAVDLAKNVFEIAVSAHPGKVAERHRVSRAKMLPFFAERQAALVVMEACGSAHYWGARIQELGHEVRLLPPVVSRVVPRPSFRSFPWRWRVGCAAVPDSTGGG